MNARIPVRRPAGPNGAPRSVGRRLRSGGCRRHRRGGRTQDPSGPRECAIDGSLQYSLSGMASLPRGAVVVEDRYSRLFKIEHVKPGFVPELLARLQVRYPSVPIVFCETRPLAEQWVMRFLAAALVELRSPPPAGRRGPYALRARPNRLMQPERERRGDKSAVRAPVC